MIQKETTGMILRKLRGDRTQEEIAAILGITKSSWAMYISIHTLHTEGDGGIGKT